jgi:hypothetical protein
VESKVNCRLTQGARSRNELKEDASQMIARTIGRLTPAAVLFTAVSTVPLLCAGEPATQTEKSQEDACLGFTPATVQKSAKGN